MCPTRHFVLIFFNPVFQLSTAKNEINLFNNHILIVAPVTFAPAGAMTPSAEFLLCFRFDELTELGAFMRTKFLCISVLRVASGPRVKLACCKSALKLSPPPR